MEGRGVTNYSVDKPSYAFSGATTEFDDALIQRGIVTKEQALAAKGMSMELAQRLANPTSQEATHSTTEQQVIDDDDTDDDADDDDDDGFLAQYRAKRFAQLEQEHAHKTRARQYQYGGPIVIDRTEWKRHVNDDSNHVWVVVCLTSSDTERTGCLEQSVRELAAHYTTTKFVMIAAHSAIAHWPVENLPSLFLYRHGTMQHELVRLPVNMSATQLLDELKERSVLS